LVDHDELAAFVVDRDGPHERAAKLNSVARVDVDMP
jgi:hypothetical protein